MGRLKDGSRSRADTDPHRTSSHLLRSRTCNTILTEEGSQMLGTGQWGAVEGCIPYIPQLPLPTLYFNHYTNNILIKIYIKQIQHRITKIINF